MYDTRMYTRYTCVCVCNNRMEKMKENTLMMRINEIKFSYNFNFGGVGYAQLQCTKVTN